MVNRPNVQEELRQRPILLFQHGVEFEGKKPLGVITNIETTGRFSAQLFDVATSAS